MATQTETRTKTFTAGAALEKNRRVRFSTGKLAYAAADSQDAIGVLTRETFADLDLVAVDLYSAQGTMKHVASEPITQYAAVYAAASGKIAASGTVLVGIALDAATANNDIIEVLPSPAAILGSVARTGLTQDDLKPYPVPVRDLRVWDAPSTVAVAATAANDDLAVVYNTFLTAAPTVETGDLKNTTTTRKVGFQFELPAEYVAGQTITLRMNAGMKTTVASASCTLDAQVARQAAPTVDVCATAAQSINNLSAADKDFTITPTDCVPGDVLDVVLTIVVTDSATGTAVIGKINSIQMLLDVKG